MENTFEVIFYEEDGSFWGEVKDVKGCYSQGDTFIDFTKNMQKAIALHLDIDENSIVMNFINGV